MKHFQTVSRFSMRTKVALAALLAVTAVAVPAITMAGLGSERETKAYTQGMQGMDHVQFNSITGVPNYGDERDFMRAKVGAGTATDSNYADPLNTIKSGDEVTVRVYVHNNADADKNADGSGVAKNTRVKVTLPTGLNQNQVASAFVSADNAQPQTIEDTLNLTAAVPVELQYVPGSAAIKTNQQEKALGDELVTNGVLIGDDNLAGNMKGCFEYVALVTFKVKVSAPAYTLQKNVRLNATDKFADEVTAKPGDKVEFNLGFKNSGTTNMNNVVIGDRLPVGLTYVPGSTQWNSHQTNQQWTKITNEEWMKGGINVGSFLPDATVLVRFSATVDDASKLQCGLNQIVNHGFAKPEGQTTIQDSATVKVTKECETPTPTPVPTPTPTPTPTPMPIYSCGEFLVEKGGDRTVIVKKFVPVAKDGATFKHVVIYWGDGKEELTNNLVAKTHVYAADGNYNIRAVAHFDVNGQTVTAGESPNCAAVVSFVTPVVDATPQVPADTETPDVLAAAGVGSVASMFVIAALIGALVYRLMLGRKLTR
jgi:uncharacterized repeat protein (TIGR01451 family)